jgi:hypothetical protein
VHEQTGMRPIVELQADLDAKARRSPLRTWHAPKETAGSKPQADRSRSFDRAARRSWCKRVFVLEYLQGLLAS